MSVLGITATQKPKPRRFWHRQFANEATSSQRHFDIVVGVIGPILCFVFDPAIFRGGFLGDPLYARYQVVVYLFSGLEIVTLLLWLILGERLYWRRMLGGVMVAGGAFCLTVGCLLLPLSLVGLMIGIGIFGFTPFLTAIVYLRNGVRSIRSETQVTRAGRILPLVFGCLLAIGAPASLSILIQQTVSSSVNAILQGDSQRAVAARKTLKWLNPLTGTELDRIVNTYAAEQDAARRDFLRRSYLEITGEDIEARLEQRRQLID